ncbi:MAG: DHH family phosphoesterase [Oscillospiraceae bacterium]
MVSVDVAGREMLCKGAQTLPVDLLLDHHGTNPGFAARGHIDPSAGACGEIIYRVLTAMGLRLTVPRQRPCTWPYPRTPDASAIPTPPPTPCRWRPPVWRPGRRPTPLTSSCLKPPACAVSG